MARDAPLWRLWAKLRKNALEAMSSSWWSFVDRSSAMKSITYSKNIFVPVIDLCRNRCGYCSFHRDLEEAHLVSRSEALQLMEDGALAGCSEALFTFGERPWDVPGFEQIFSASGAADLMDFLMELCEMALEHELLPHTN